MYSLKEPSLISQLRDLAVKNEEELQSSNVAFVNYSEELLNIQYRIASHYIHFLDPAMPIGRSEKYNPILFSVFHKNLMLLFSALELNRKGLFGAARSVNRNVFEGLMIAKYFNISSDFSILERWSETEPIYLTKMVLNKIISPDSTIIKEYWSMLCDYAHPTRYSAQVWADLDARGEFEEVISTFGDLLILLECNYHLLNTQMINDRMEHKVRFYATHYVKTEKPFEIPALRARAHEIFKKLREDFKPLTIKLIYTYKRKWTLR
jgi:hypothetical protein